MSLLIRHSRISSARHHRQLHVSVCVCLAKSVVNESVTHCYAKLNVSAACSNDELRDAYLSLVKKYHPDSISGHANADKFAQVEDSYRRILVSIYLCFALFAMHSAYLLIGRMVSADDSSYSKAINLSVYVLLLLLLLLLLIEYNFDVSAVICCYSIILFYCGCLLNSALLAGRHSVLLQSFNYFFFYFLSSYFFVPPNLRHCLPHHNQTLPYVCHCSRLTHSFKYLACPFPKNFAAQRHQLFGTISDNFVT